MADVRINAMALQFAVTMDAARNLETLLRLADAAPAHTLIVAPEGALSGYAPEPGMVARLDNGATARAIDQAAAFARARSLHLVVGACVQEAGVWRNRSLYFGPNGAHAHYDKINLAMSERAQFTPGDALPVFDLDIAGARVRLGVQMCREIRYPEQWRALAAQGAQIIAYPNNAIASTIGHALWRAHLISRAAESQRFIIGANNAAPDQTCPTMIVAPRGEAIAEAPIGATCAITQSLALSEVSDWVLSQAREDVVRVALAKRD